MTAFDYQLTRSARRKSLSIVVRRGQVKVMAPVFVPRFAVERFIRDKTEWVVAKLKEQQLWADEQASSKKQWVDGETFLHFGNVVVLKVLSAGKSGVSLDGDALNVSLSSRVKAENRQSHIKKLLQQWYKSELEGQLPARIAHFCAQMAVEPVDVSVRSYTRRWGSCTASGKISFNLLLSMAPYSVIDYVIVHELCHLVHMDHSPRFWSLVEAYCPDYRQAKAYLKQQGALLRLD